MSKPEAQRHENEVSHGKYLSESGAEDVWGWGSAAGQIRAERRGEMLRAAGHIAEGDSVLEVGCGTGLFTEWMARSGANLYAVDISEELIEIANQRGLDPEKVRFETCPFETCEGAGTYDAVVGSSILHHLEIRPALERIFELLKPGGYMAFGEPNMLNPHIAVIKNIKWIGRRLGESEDETAFVRWAFAKMLREVGFVEVSVEPVEWLHPITPKALIPLMQGATRVLERIPLVREIGGSLTISARKPE